MGTESAEREIESLRLELEAERRVLGRELEIARRIQLGLMPAATPALPGWDIATAYRAARTVGGDFYDVYELPRRPGTIGVAVADVTGKGITAALMMAFSRAVLRSAAYNGTGPADALLRTNRVLAADVRAGLFLTALALELDSSTGSLRYASAGHEAPLLVDGRTGGVVELPCRGELLGMFEDLDMTEESVFLHPDDLVVAYTDGVTDARDRQGDRFGFMRLRQVAATCRGLPAREAIERILDAIERFAGGEAPADDVTLVTVRRLAGDGDDRPRAEPASAVRRLTPSPAGAAAPSRQPSPAGRVAARYGHTNLVARDWQALAAFYGDCFGCVPVPPERDFKGKELDAGTGLVGAHLRGAHLRLPGHGLDGPTLEIYSYDEIADGSQPAANRLGWGHIAFAVDDVGAARAEVVRRGGRPIGEVVTLQTSDRRRVTWCYVTDPEGNIVELQAWSDPATG